VERRPDVWRMGHFYQSINVIRLFSRNVEDHLGSPEVNLYPFVIFQDLAITATLTHGLDIIYSVSVFENIRIVSTGLTVSCHELIILMGQLRPGRQLVANCGSTGENLSRIIGMMASGRGLDCSLQFAYQVKS
jgi:hypothetical protein